MKIDEFFEKFPKCNAYSNKLFINEILSPMYGDYVEKVLDLIVPEVPTKDLEGNNILIDFVIETKTAKYAIEVDDFQTHGAHISPKQQSKDYLKKESLRYEYKEKFIQIAKFNIDTEKNRAFDTLWRAFRADPDLNRTCGTEIKPHEIQKQTLDFLNERRAKGENKGLVCYATGLGKTYLSAFDVKQVIGEKKNKGGKALFLVHRNEILEKAEQSFRDVLPNKSRGFYNAETKNTKEDIIFGSIQTIYRQEHLNKFSKKHFDYIIMDETHHASDENITYRNILKYFQPKYLLGLTATPTRTDEFNILKDVYDGNLVYEIDQYEAVQKGYLVPCEYNFLTDNIDYTNITWHGNKYYEDDLNEKLLVPKRDKKIIDEYKALKPKPLKTLGFCIGIKHAERMAEVFNKEGIKSRAIHSGNKDFPLTKDNRKKYTKEFENSKIEVAFVKDIFNEGIDIKQIDCLFILRPTESSTIAIQQLGRGLRLAPGKDKLRVLNFIGKNQRNSFLPYDEFIGDPPLNEKGEYIYDNGNKVIFSKELVNIFKQQNALYSQTLNLKKIPKKWIEWGKHIEKEIDENLYLKINKQNHDIQTHLHGCLIYKDNPNISDDNFKKEIAKYTKKNKLPPMTAGVRGMNMSKLLGLYIGGRNKKVTNIFKEIQKRTNDFSKFNKYDDLIENQLQKICFWNGVGWLKRDSQNPKAKEFNKLFKNYIFITLYKVLLNLGDQTRQYKITYNEWCFFVIFSRSFSDSKDITKNILNFRKEEEFYKIERYLDVSSKRIDERISDLFYLSSVLKYNEHTNEISIKTSKIDYTKKIISNFEKKLKENKIPFPLENGDKGEYEEMLYNPEPFWE